MDIQALQQESLKALRKMHSDAMAGDDGPELAVIPEHVLRRYFGDEAVDAAFANGTASYLTEDDEV